MKRKCPDEAVAASTPKRACPPLPAAFAPGAPGGAFSVWEGFEGFTPRAVQDEAARRVVL